MLAAALTPAALVCLGLRRHSDHELSPDPLGRPRTLLEEESDHYRYGPDLIMPLLLASILLTRRHVQVHVALQWR
jgi:hypothetical protein